MAVKITPEYFAAQGSEEGHQIALFVWAQQNKQAYPELEWLFAIPNGGSRHKAEAGNLVAAGVKRGVPDIGLMVRRVSYHGLFIELKKLKGGVISPDQQKWIDHLQFEGYYACVCIGWEAARDCLIEYLKMRK